MLNEQSEENNFEPFMDFALVGLPLEEAKKMAASQELVLRITMKDGVPLVGTCDIRRDRVNVAVVNGIVTSVKRG